MLTDLFFRLLFDLLWAYSWAIILAAIVSTLLAFNVLDTRNRVVWSIADFLARITEPVLRPIRRVVPTIGGLDFSPLIALVLVVVVQRILQWLQAGYHGYWAPLF